MPTYARHAETAMAERGIERAWVELTLSHPEATEPDPLHPGRIRAFRAIPERGGRILRVVYDGTNDEPRIITVFYDRSWRRAT